MANSEKVTREYSVLFDIQNKISKKERDEIYEFMKTFKDFKTSFLGEGKLKLDFSATGLNAIEKNLNLIIDGIKNDLKIPVSLDLDHMDKMVADLKGKIKSILSKDLDNHKFRPIEEIFGKKDISRVALSVGRDNALKDASRIYNEYIKSVKEGSEVSVQSLLNLVDAIEKVYAANKELGVDRAKYSAKGMVGVSENETTDIHEIVKALQSKKSLFKDVNKYLEETHKILSGLGADATKYADAIEEAAKKTEKVKATIKEKAPVQVQSSQNVAKTATEAIAVEFDQAKINESLNKSAYAAITAYNASGDRIPVEAETRVLDSYKGQSILAQLQSIKDTYKGTEPVIELGAKAVVNAHINLVRKEDDETIRVAIDRQHLLKDLEESVGTNIRYYNASDSIQKEPIRVNIKAEYKSEEGSEGLRVPVDRQFFLKDLEQAIGTNIRYYNASGAVEKEFIRVKVKPEFESGEGKEGLQIPIDRQLFLKDLQETVGTYIRYYNSSDAIKKELVRVGINVTKEGIESSINNAASQIKKLPEVSVNVKPTKDSLNKLGSDFSGIVEKAVTKAPKTSLNAQKQVIQDAFDAAKTKATVKSDGTGSSGNKTKKSSDEAEKQREINRELKEREKIERQIFSVRDALIKKIVSSESGLVNNNDVERARELKETLLSLTDKKLSGKSTTFLQETLNEIKSEKDAYDDLLRKNKELIEQSKKQAKDEAEKQREVNKELKEREQLEDKIIVARNKLLKSITSKSGTFVDQEDVSRAEKLKEALLSISRDGLSDLSAKELKEKLDSIKLEKDSYDEMVLKNQELVRAKKEATQAEKELAKEVERTRKEEEAASEAEESRGTISKERIKLLREMGKYASGTLMRRASEGNILENYVGTEEQLERIRRARDEIKLLIDMLKDPDIEMSDDYVNAVRDRFVKLTGDLERATARISKKSLFGERQGLIDREAIKSVSDFRNLIKEVEGIGAGTRVTWSDKYKGDIVTMTGAYEDEAGAIKTVSYSLDTLNGTYKKVGASEKQQLSFTERLTKLFKQRSEALLAYIGTFASFYRVMGEMRKGVEIIKLLDTNMTELRRVSGATTDALNSFRASVYDIGREIGSTGDNIIKLAADYARLGYSLNEASELARASAIYMNVGFIDDANFAMESLTSTMKAYGMQASEVTSIVDKFNEVGNSFAISSQGIGEALKRSAAALSQANNDLDKSIALVVAANNVVQDPQVVGTALRTVALRIRGKHMFYLCPSGEKSQSVFRTIKYAA